MKRLMMKRLLTSTTAVLLLGLKTPALAAESSTLGSARRLAGRLNAGERAEPG
jgi:hypothetical protein